MSSAQQPPVVTDQFAVTGAWDKAAYQPGDVITGRISGGDVQTTVTQVPVTVGPVTVPIAAADGATASVVFPAQTNVVPVTVVLPESVVIDRSRPIVDNGPTPRAWVVSADGLSITAKA